MNTQISADWTKALTRNFRHKPTAALPKPTFIPFLLALLFQLPMTCSIINFLKLKPTVMERNNTPVWMIASEVELIYKSKVKASERPTIQSSNDAYQILLKSWDEGKIEYVEQFAILLLNRANKVLGVYKVSSGGVTGTVADPKQIFTAALKANACSLVLSHNHPSGALKPSRQDEELTRKIKEAGSYLDIKVLDHLIVTNESYYSFADEGLL